MKEIITITVEYGSDFQRQVKRELLCTMLAVFHSTMESSHKKNSCIVTFSEKQ